MFDKVNSVWLGSDVELCEIGCCFEGTTLRLRVYAARNRLGVWTVVVSEPGGHRIRNTYPDEATARAKMELAYRFGRDNGGWWFIERRGGYRPDPGAGPFSRAGAEKTARDGHFEQRPRA